MFDFLQVSEFWFGAVAGASLVILVLTLVLLAHHLAEDGSAQEDERLPWPTNGLTPRQQQATRKPASSTNKPTNEASP